MVIVGLVATEVVLRFDPAHVGWITAAPLLVAGVGSGLFVAPNQTVTLSEVPPVEGSTAAAVMKTGQRIATAIGIAAVAGVFFAGLTSTGGDYSTAISRGLIVTLAIVALALVVGLLDVWSGRRSARTADSVQSSG